MATDAEHKITKSDVEHFLKRGFFMGLGPDRCLVAWGKSEKLKSPIPGEVQFFIPDFFMLEKSPWVRFEFIEVVNRSELTAALGEFANQPVLDLRWQNPSREDFTKQFECVKQAISESKFRKAVPISFSQAQGTVTKSRRANLLQNLLRKATKATPYGYWTESEGVMGATPELLFSYDANEKVLITMALAGTRDSAAESKSTLAHDRSASVEHELVVKGLKEKLKPYGEINVSPTYVLDLGNLAHLKTDISVEFVSQKDPQALFNELCDLLHPTAALGLAPTSADWHFLKNCDGKFDRRRYGAPFGVLNLAGRSYAYVAIRNLQWVDDQLLIGAGCGVVEDSELDTEWQEVELKRRVIRDMLGI